MGLFEATDITFSFCSVLWRTQFIQLIELACLIIISVCKKVQVSQRTAGDGFVPDLIPQTLPFLSFASFPLSPNKPPP